MAVGVRTLTVCFLFCALCCAIAPTARSAPKSAGDVAPLPPAVGRHVDFVKDVQPILSQSCYACHGPSKQKSGLRWDIKANATKGGESGPAFVPGKSGKSLMIQLVSGQDPDRIMPAKGPRLTAERIGVLRAWIDQGAVWSADADKAVASDGSDHWAYKPMTRPAVPQLADEAVGRRVRNPIDAFVLTKLAEKGLTPSPEADRRTLIRRVCFDVTGLPPAPEQVQTFVADPDPQAYEKLVDKLLASPRYGECWARHWLDAVHYGDTHGYDKDKPRPNAWPYRDYVIRSFNEDKPYGRFVEEQLAGDKLYPGTPDGIVALGFIAAGPFDFVGQVELREGTVDKAITRNLDRDDMVAATMNTFISMTAQCARCHDHKFDPITQEDYYSLQAVFAGVDRADRPYDADPAVAKTRQQLRRRQDELAARSAELEKRAREAVGPELAAVDARLAALSQPAPADERPEFGYHSAISAKQDAVKWVQVDLGRPTPIDSVVLVGAFDTFAGIGAGFGFPVRYKVEAGNDPQFKKDATVLVDHTAADVPNPGTVPQAVPAHGQSARYVRLTATKLALRQGDYILAMAEMAVLTPDGVNAALNQPVIALDSIEASPRWRKQNLVDGIYHGAGHDRLADAAKLSAQRQALLDKALDENARRELREVRRESEETIGALTKLPATGLVFAAATDFPPAGSFTPTHGKPRPVHVLARGSEKNPKQLVGPGTVACIQGLPSRFDLPPTADEADGRAALAKWITDRRNPLTWRSIVNRVWQYHFGHGIAGTPNDFGKMGTPPTHPELLDWLAVEFRDGGQSLKQLHRLILTSSTYRQSSADDPADAKIDGDNRYLWRMNRQKLDAEQVHDAVLAAAGKLDLTMGGPGYKTFGFEDDHSPRYKYQDHDPDDATTCRRAVYRFVVRSVPDPFMETLDCADPSQVVARRNETLTALQALAMLNDKFMLRMAEHLAERAEKCAPDLPGRVDVAFRLALGRTPTEKEKRVLLGVAEREGLADVCRVILNTNEFAFVD